MPAIARIAELAEEFKAIRQYFHQYPELSGQEFETAEKIAQYLESWGIEVHRHFGGTGLVGVLKNGSSTKAVALRADMDALAVQEANRFAHASKNHGVMHACGHDGHITTLLLAARYLAETKNFDGTVYFVFQPAEETLTGALDIIEAARLDGLSEIRIFFQMFIPTMKSTYAAAMTITFMNAWNSYMWPKVIMTQSKSMTMPMVVANLTEGYVTDYGMLMLAVLICTLPTALVFFILQKSFAEGITGAVK